MMRPSSVHTIITSSSIAGGAHTAPPTLACHCTSPDRGSTWRTLPERSPKAMPRRSAASWPGAWPSGSRHAMLTTAGGAGAGNGVVATTGGAGAVPEQGLVPQARRVRAEVAAPPLVAGADAASTSSRCSSRGGGRRSSQLSVWTIGGDSVSEERARARAAPVRALLAPLVAAVRAVSRRTAARRAAPRATTAFGSSRVTTRDAEPLADQLTNEWQARRTAHQEHRVELVDGEAGVDHRVLHQIDGAFDVVDDHRLELAAVHDDVAVGHRHEHLGRGVRRQCFLGPPRLRQQIECAHASTCGRRW